MRSLAPRPKKRRTNDGGSRWTIVRRSSGLSVAVVTYLWIIALKMVNGKGKIGKHLLRKRQHRLLAEVDRFRFRPEGLCQKCFRRLCHGTFNNCAKDLVIVSSGMTPFTRTCNVKVAIQQTLVSPSSDHHDGPER